MKSKLSTLIGGLSLLGLGLLLPAPIQAHPHQLSRTPEAIDAAPPIPYPQNLKPGSNEMLRAPTSMAENVEVIVSDVIIPANSSLPPHYHPGEEFIYLIEGSVVHVEAGQPNRVMKAGDTVVIPAGVVHAPYTEAEAARAIVFRVHTIGQPERIEVNENTQK